MMNVDERAEYEPADDERREARPQRPPVRARLRGYLAARPRTMIGRGAVALLGLALVAGSALFLGLTIFSQTRPQKTPEVKYAPPIPVRTTPRTSPYEQLAQPAAGGPAAPGAPQPGANEPNPALTTVGRPKVAFPMESRPNFEQSDDEPAARAPKVATPAGPPYRPRPGRVQPEPAPAGPPAGHARTSPEATPQASPEATPSPAPLSAAAAPRTAAPANTAPGRTGELRRVAGKTFRRDAQGVWIDTTFEPNGQMPTVEVAAGSPDYVKLLEEHRELGPYFRFSDALVVVLDGAVYRVVPRP